jgi:membrane associated rhomboid family serine protease
VSSASWWFRSSDGRLTLWQWPNAALCVWAVALVVGRFDPSAAHAAAVDGIRRGALLVWALDEVVRGASPFRRTLGAVVLVGQLASLVMS